MAWRETTVGEVVTLQRGYDITQAHQVEGGVPVISSGGVSSWHNEAMADGPGVVIGRKGTLGKVFFSEGPFWPHDTTLWVSDFKGSHPRFVYYYFKSLDLTFLDVGSANPTLNRNHVHPLVTRWPPLPTQRAIAEVLGALDDKIAANHQVALAADAVAQVQFEVLCARGDGEVSLSSLVSTQYGLTTSPAQAGGPKLARVTDINKLPWIDWSRAPSCDAGPGDQAKYGLAVEDILVARMADPGKVGIVDESAPEAVFASYLVRLRPGPLLEPLVLYYFLRSPAYVDYCQSSRQGSVQSNMNARVIVAANIPTIDRQLQHQFASDARMLRRRMSAAIIESNRLAELRDTLLPHLMSGRLTVREAEKHVEEVL